MLNPTIIKLVFLFPRSKRYLTFYWTSINRDSIIPVANYYIAQLEVSASMIYIYISFFFLN